MRRRRIAFDALIAFFGALLISLAFAPLSPAAAQELPSWTLTKTANPTTYSAAGQVIKYSYLITNTGNVPIGSTTITDDKVATVSCPNFGIVTLRLHSHLHRQLYDYASRRQRGQRHEHGDCLRHSLLRRAVRAIRT